VLRSIVPLLQDVMHEPAGACPQLANATPPASGGAVRVHAVPPARSPARAASPST
jgi:hypothetical protein